jgi:hypothetical protein
MKDKINELEKRCINKKIRDLYTGIIECKRGYQAGTCLIKDVNGDLLIKFL